MFQEVQAVLEYLRTVKSQTPAPKFPPEAHRPLALIGANCLNCHRLDGEGTQFGPDLDRAGATADADYLERWITDPSQHDPGTHMPGFGGRLAASDIRFMAEYLASRK